MLTIGIVSTVALAVAVCLFIYGRRFDRYNCGPRALMVSVQAVNVIPRNRPLDNGKKKAFQLGASKLNSERGRICVNVGVICCCLCGCVAIAGAVIAVAVTRGGQPTEVGA